MSKKYYYGAEDEEIYTHENINDAIDEITSNMWEGSNEPCVMVEMVNSRKSEATFCIYHNEFLETVDCGRSWCDEYEPRNKKNGICKYHSYGLIETGRKWKVYHGGTIKKISGRKRN
jgi:hypothetical protein